MANRETKVTLSAQVAEYNKAMESAAKSTRELGSEAEKLAQQREAFQQLGRSAALGGAALTAATALSVKAAIEWESAWAGVTKTVDGTDAQMAELEDQLRSLTAVLPATHEEIAGVAEAAGQLGVERENIADFTKTMIDLAETTNLTADEAATSIAQLMNVMQTAPEDVDNLGAALVALGNDGASTERDIVEMAQRIAGAGEIVGLTEAQVLGFANALASVGIEAEAGGSAISRIMTDIAMSVSAGGEDLERFAEVAGMSSQEFQKAFNEDPANAIATFVEGLGKIDAAGGDVFKTLADLGQSDIRVSQALLGMANSGDLLRKSLELGGVAWEENLALVEEARKRYETTEAQIQIAGNSIRDAAIDLGAVFLPAVKDGADAIAGLAQGFADLPEPVQGIIGLLSGTAGVVALTGGAALLAVPKIVEFRTALATMGTTASRVALVGGGVTVALTALVAVVGTLAQKQAQARQRAEGYAQALEQGADAARDLAIENLAMEKSVLGVDFGSAYDNAEKLGVSYQLVTDAVSGNARALEDLNEILDAATGGGSEAQAMADELGLSYVDLAQSAGTLKEALQDETDGLARGKEIREQVKNATDENTESTKTAAEAYIDAASGASDLDDELTTLLETINEANGVGQDAISANIAYKDSLAEIDDVIQKAREGIDENNDGLADYVLTLDEGTDAGRRNKEMLVDLAREAEEAAKKQFELDGDTENYRKTLEDSRQALLDRAEDLGANADEAKNLVDQILTIPSETEWTLIANTAAAESAVNRLITMFDGTQFTVPVRGSADWMGPGRAGGGPIIGPGTSTSDSILTPTSNGEHIWSAAEVQAAGGHDQMEAWRHAVLSGQEQQRHWVYGGAPTAGSGGGDSSAGKSVNVTQNIYPAEGMSEAQIARIAAERMAFEARGN
jgi:TP901 family phage tail tape measure protein